MAFSILSDAPASRDLLNFDRYLDPLVDLLTGEVLETPLTVGIFGTWGSGKSTLLGLLTERLNAHEGKFLCVPFNPWIYRRETNLLIPLLHSIHDALTKGMGGKFADSAARISEVLVRVGANALLRHITVDKVDLDQLEKYEKAYIERKGLIDNQLRNLHETFRQQAQTLHEAGVTMVLLIDDLDRCDPTEMIDLLECVKLFLDVKHVVHVLAVDKEVIDRGVEVKYGKFNFSDERKGALGAEYMEKMVQIPVYLYPLHETQVKGYIRALDLSQEVNAQINLLAEGLSPNPRKIKRVLNAVALTRQALRQQQVNWSLVTGLAILRIERPEVYADVARLPKMLIALQNVYAKKWSVRDVNDFAKEFGEKAEFVRSRCERHYSPASPLAAIFALDFKQEADRLAEYISVVGGR